MKDSNFLKEMNARHMWHPMTHPAESLSNPPKIVTGASGTTITDIDGHQVVDAVGGLWNMNLGASCQPIKNAIPAQLEHLLYYNIFRGIRNDVSIGLSTILAESFNPDGLSRAIYTSVGSGSVETALRLAGPCLAALEEEIAFQGPGTMAAFIMEPILGAPVIGQ